MAAVGPLYDAASRDTAGLRAKLDFGSMLRLGLRLLAETAHGRSYAERFEHVLVDEFQDTSGLQCELVCHLAAHHRNLFVVGDQDQGIYSWRQASTRTPTACSRTSCIAGTYRTAHTPLLVATANLHSLRTLHLHCIYSAGRAR